MKNMIKIFSLLLVMSFVSSCDDDEYIKSNIALTQVYQLSDFAAKGAPFKINVYKEENTLVRYLSNVVLNAFNTKNYVDASTGNTTGETGTPIFGQFDISVTAYETILAVDSDTGDQNSVNMEYRYHIVGSKEDGKASMTCVHVRMDEEGEVKVKTETLDLIISEKKIYR